MLEYNVLVSSLHVTAGHNTAMVLINASKEQKMFLMLVTFTVIVYVRMYARCLVTVVYTLY